MSMINVEKISKQFGQQIAVDQVSFVVEPGEIFGLLGPNGAGKTTTLRIILDIFKPDSGIVEVMAGPMTESKKNRIGYLPEERGLYQDIPLEGCLVYLATLKGLSSEESLKRVRAWLERFDLLEHRKKKVKELSKGMQQKAQLISTLVHDPELIIIDEPFASLDPVNTQMVKDLLQEERDRGKAIVMCTHQMHHAEELCDRLVLINRGQVVLYGRLDEIRKKYTGSDVFIHALDSLPASIPGVIDVKTENSSTRLHLSNDLSPQELLRYLVSANINIDKFELAFPTLDEIFIQIVTEKEPLL